jgi:hypothetical protein
MRVSRIALLMMAFAFQPMHSWAAESETSEYTEPREMNNPAPKVALNSFDRFEVAPVAMGAPFAGDEVNEDAKQRLQINLDERATPLLAEWNAREAKSSPPGRSRSSRPFVT